MSKNYKVSFYKLKKEEDAKGDVIVTEKQFLGSITVDDSGVDQNLTLTAKAFRRASPACQLADKVTVEQV